MDCVLRIRTWDHRMVGLDESTELDSPCYKPMLQDLIQKR